MADIATLGLKIDGVDGVDKAEKSLDNLADAADRAERSTDDLGDRSRRTGGDLGDLADQGDQASSSVNTLAGAARTAGAALIAAFSAAALLGAFKSSMSIFIDFEAQMARIGAVSGATAADMQKLTATARDLGAATTFTATQVGSGLESLTRAGWSVNESISAIPAILSLSTVASIELGEAADAASGIMSGFSIAAEDAWSVADILAVASSNANTNISELSSAMSYAGPVAKALGVSMGDTAAAVGVLSDANIKGSAAGTGLRRILSSLINPTKAARDALRDLKVNVSDVNPETSELADIVDRLAKSGIGAAEAFEIFGDRGAPAILALAEGRAKLRDLSGTLKDVTGAALRMDEVISDTLETDLLLLSSAIDGVKTSIGLAFSSSSRNLVQSLTSAISAFGEKIDTVLATVVLATKLTAIYIATFYALRIGIILASIETSAYILILRLMSTEAAMTTRQLLTMRSALSLAAAAFAGWEIGKYLRREFEFFEKFGIALMAGLHQMAVRIAGEFRIMGEKIKFFISNPVDAARGYIVDFLKWVNSLGTKALEFLGLEGLISGAGKDWDKLRGATANEHKKTIEQMRTELADEIKGINEVYNDMFQEVGKGVKEAAEEVADGSKKLAEAAGDVSDNINEVSDSLDKLKTKQDAILKELTALERAVKVWGKTATEVKLYDLMMMGALDTQLKYAKSLLDIVDGYEKTKKAQDDYLSLVKDLRTDEELVNDTLRERIAILDAIGTAGDQDYMRVAAGAMKDAPSTRGLAQEAGGALGEMNKIDKNQDEVFDWYSNQLFMLEQYRADYAHLNEHWNQIEADTHAKYNARMDDIEKARHAAKVAAGQEFFGNLTDVTKAFFGENSKLYKAAFAMEKAYAIQKALMAVPETYINAYKATSEIPVVGPYLAPAAGALAAAAIVGQAAMIGSVSAPSFDGGGYTGDGARSGGLDGKGGFLAMMHPRETVVDHTKGQSSGGGNVVVNLHEDASKAGQVQEQRGENDQRVIDVFVSNIMGDGQIASVMQNKFGLTAQGR